MKDRTRRKRTGRKPRALPVEKVHRRGPGRPQLFFRDLVGPALDAKRLRGNSEASLAKDRQRLDRIAPMLSGIPARKITAGIVERVLEALARGDGHHGPLRGSTVNRYHSAISSVLRYSARQKFIATNPLAAAAVPWSKEQKVHVRFLGGDEEARLLKVIRADCPDREAEIELALLTGMRRSEQFLAKWEDWSREAGILHVKGKTGAREVQVSMAARAALEALRARAPESQLFITPEANEAATDRRKWFEHAAKRAGLRPVFHWRDLRHTFASRLAMAGISLLTIQELCGHATFTTTLRYAHLSPAHRKEAVEKVGMSTFGATAGQLAGDSIAPLSTTFASKTNESEQS